MVPDFGDSIRLRTWLKFRVRDNNWSKTVSAVIDTGAPISVLPWLDEEGNRTREAKIYAFLAFSDLIPIVLGFKHLLEHFKISFECEAGHAWLQDTTKNPRHTR